MDQQQQPQNLVVVCGGGVIGVCTAYFLAKKGATVTLVEKSSVACAAPGQLRSVMAEVPDDRESIRADLESIRVLKRVTRTVSRHLSEGKANVKAEQACFVPCTDDGEPVIGEIPGVNGCYVATGHNYCWGILNGTATGVAMAELVLDGQASILDLSSPARFNRSSIVG